MKLVAVIGNASSGLTFIGPFDTYEAAFNWIKAGGFRDWHIAPLRPPLDS